MPGMAAMTRWLVFPAAFWLLVTGFAYDQTQTQTPPDRVELVPAEMQGIDVDESNLGQTIPLGLDFVDEHGRAVKLSEYFQPDRPVILNLGYYRCPMLCSLVMDSISDLVEEMDWVPGEDYHIVTATIDPRETPEEAMARKQEVLTGMDPAVAEGWSFLTGGEADIKSLADSVGFKYRYIERQDQYSHAAAIIVLSPEGRISRYFVMLNYPARTVRLSLVEASEGKIGSTLDRILLTCWQYDAAEGRYVPLAMGLMRIGAALTVTALAVGVGALFLYERIRRRGRRTAAA
ncbi:SCO family protein [Mucisphaera calidilacus]|uniref:Thioredoxin domain-containing protein n=1 Tax=Mucisphaera calidilacus TaxID=2527982 RepID=A0A518C0D4_9BACT|nr:SCO family protein [Mucisphaera calidilacus]QDU72685.1 hypothetical protein Pan265_25590 [Mucisphaera calidilacus]